MRNSIIADNSKFTGLMMNSSGAFQFFDLLKSFLLSGAFGLLGACVPREFLLEREDAPRGSWLDMLGLQNRACHECAITFV
jgi:hypothetical protein